MLFAFAFLIPALLVEIVQSSDAAGNVQYRADPLHGFTATGSNIPALILPEPAKDLPEISKVKAKHLEALKLAEENAKKAIDAKILEVKGALPTQSEIIALPYSSPIIQPIAAFGYSYAGLSTPQIISTYSAPAPYLFIGAPILKSVQPSNMAGDEANKGESSGVVAARDTGKMSKSEEKL